MKSIFLATLVLAGLSGFGQINMADSTVQAITYWEKGEKHNYVINTRQFKLNGADTTARETITYDVDVKVLEANNKSYTIQWFYKNIKSNNQSEIMQKIAGVTKDMKIAFKTNELGIFIEVVNWKEMKAHIEKAIAVLKTDLKNNSDMEKVLDKIAATFSTKEAIEATAIKDILQFHSFYGVKYKLGEVLAGGLKVPNIYGKEPFDAEFTAYLDEINEGENSFILRSTQEVSKEQLTNAVFEYATTLAKNIKTETPKKENFKYLKNEALTTSRISGNGWLVYSMQTSTTSTDGSTNIEERVIEIK
jgi:hypothetical protein